jgi:hypothetical protein
MNRAPFTNLPASIRFPARSVDDGKPVSAIVCGPRSPLPDVVFAKLTSSFSRRHNADSRITAGVRLTATMATPTLSKVEQIMGMSDLERPSPTRGASQHLMCETLEVQPLALVSKNAADFQ